MEKIRALFGSANGRVAVQEVTNYGRTTSGARTIEFVGDDGDRYIALMDEVFLVPVVN